MSQSLYFTLTTYITYELNTQIALHSILLALNPIPGVQVTSRTSDRKLAGNYYSYCSTKGPPQAKCGSFRHSPTPPGWVGRVPTHHLPGRRVWLPLPKRLPLHYVLFSCIPEIIHSFDSGWLRGPG